MMIAWAGKYGQQVQETKQKVTKNFYKTKTESTRKGSVNVSYVFRYVVGYVIGKLLKVVIVLLLLVLLNSI